jgi:transposase
VPAIWLPDPAIRAERERARFRLHLVRHRSSLKQRVHALLLAHGKPCPLSDLFGASGRALLAHLALPEPWAGTLAASLRLIDELDAEIAACESGRFPSPTKLSGYSGLCPRVYQSGESDRRGPLSKQGPRYLRWALVEAATVACRHPIYRERYERTKRRLGKQRGPKIAQVDLARRLSEAIWHMLSRNRPFAPAGAPAPVTA